ncbi:NAD-dependent glycerol-3-phosphate dehydrogenase [Meredithblackwellia eburnea MCA 4105]
MSDKAQQKWKVAIIGSGNWGSAIARIIGINTEKNPQLFDQDVRIWCYEEQFNGRPLTEQFNEKHENVKYLPGIKISPHVVAYPDLVEAVKGANALVFVVPHQFIPNICKQLEGHIPTTARAISLVKGVEVHESKIDIFADVIEQHLSIPCSALSGANIANEVAKDEFSETTIGCRDPRDAKVWQTLFGTPMFRVQVTDDVRGVSLCGALKNVVAVAAGLIDGLNWGNNAKAAIMRIGLLEMKKFSMEFFPDVRADTFVQESAGVADLITSCLGGRNRKCAEAFVTSGKSFDELEESMLNGQKLQGVQTARELHQFLKARNKVEEYPLFTAVYRIAYEHVKPEEITSHI